MGAENGIAVAQLVMECFNGEAVGVKLGLVGNEGMARPEDRLVVAQIEDVMITAPGGIAGPFIAQKSDEFARRSEGSGLVGNLLPVIPRNLEIVALVG